MLWKNTDQLSNLTFLSVLEIPTQLNILDHSKQNESESTSSGIIVPVERNYFLSLSKLCPLLKKLFPTSSNASIGIPDLRTKAMFGEYGIYSWDRLFALVCDNTLFLKTFPETLWYFEDIETKAYPGSKNTAPVNPEWLENREELIQITKLTLALIPPPKAKKKKS